MDIFQGWFEPENMQGLECFR